METKKDYWDGVVEKIVVAWIDCVAKQGMGEKKAIELAKVYLEKV